MMDGAALDACWDCEFEEWEKYGCADRRQQALRGPLAPYGLGESRRRRAEMADEEIPKNCIDLDAFAKEDPNNPAGGEERPANLAELFRVPTHFAEVCSFLRTSARWMGPPHPQPQHSEKVPIPATTPATDV